MLTYQDEATIRNTLWNKLHEPGKTEIADIQVINHPDAVPPHIQVGIWFVLKDRIQVEGLIDPRSFFDLPAEFDRKHLLNEIDEISEQLKVVRQETAMASLVMRGPQPRKVVVGTGLRGRWGDDGKGAGARDMAPQTVQ